MAEKAHVPHRPLRRRRKVEERNERPRVRAPKERLYSPLGLHQAAKRARERRRRGARSGKA